MSKEIIIDGIKYFKQCDINKGLDEEHYVTEFHLLATHYNLLLEDYARKYNSLKKQLKGKNQKCKQLKKRLEQQEALTKTYEVCYRAKHNDVKDRFIKLKQAVDKIEKLISKFDTPSECDYGDYDCENCSSLDEEIVCGYKLKKIIKDTIKKTKEV